MLGQISFERGHDVRDRPDEDAGIPQKLAALYEGLRQFKIGLLGKALDLADRLVARTLDVAVARFGAAGAYAHRHKRVVMGNEVGALAYYTTELVGVEHQMIRRGNDHRRLRILLAQGIGRISDAGRRIASYRLAQHLLGRELGDMFEHQVTVASVGHHKKILGRHYLREAFVGAANE